MELNSLPSVCKKSRKRICRGIGSGKGKTGGRGGKGQTARSGVAINGFEGGQMPIYRRLPKQGFRPYDKQKFIALNIEDLDGLCSKYFEKGHIVTDKDVYKILGINSKRIVFKLLGGGTVSSGLKYDIKLTSKAAKEKIA
ncbi:MAG: 50S ribosomal protein L15 [Rickettsiales bacterium]